MTEITESIARRVLEVVDAGLIAGLGEPTPGKMCVEAAICFALGLPHGDDPDTCVAQALRQCKIVLNDAHWSSLAARAKGLRALALAQLGSAGVLDELEFARRLVEWTIRNMLPRALRRAASAVATAADEQTSTALERAAQQCEIEGSEAAADAARAAAHAAADAAASAAYAAAEVARIAYAAAEAARIAARAAAFATAEAAAFATAEAAAYAAYAAEAAAYAAVLAAQTAKDPDVELTLFAIGVLQILRDMGAPGIKWLSLIEKRPA